MALDGHFDDKFASEFVASVECRVEAPEVECVPLGTSIIVASYEVAG